MNSTFFGLEMARRALFTQQHSLHITGHNISNANTPGYTRQTGVHTSTHPQLSYSLRQNPKAGVTGTGVKMDEIKRMRDQFVDRDLRKQYHSMGEWEARKEALQQIEYIYNEPSESGIATAFDNFWNSWQELSKNPGEENPTARTVVLSQAEALAESINSIYQKFLDMEEQINFTINTKVDDINSLGRQIADLNDQIHMSEATGDNANDLRDKRDALIDDLSKIVNIDVNEDNYGMVSINIHGAGLVIGRNSYNLDFDMDDPESTIDWVEQEDQLKTRSGELHGLLKIRNETLPYHMNSVIDIAANLTETVNEIHMDGYDLNGDPGQHFFTGIGYDGGVNPISAEFFNTDEGTISLTSLFENGDSRIEDFYNDDGTAFTFNLLDDEGNLVPGVTIDKNANSMDITLGNLDSLDSGVYTLEIAEGGEIWNIDVGVNTNVIPTRDSNLINVNPELSHNNIAAASEPMGLEADGSNALKIGRLKHEGITGLGGATFDDYTKSLISALGVETREAVRMVDNQEVIVEQLEFKKESVSGVSLDEEMTNMIKFQHAYNSASRMVTTLDELLDVLVTRTGIVGR